MMVSDLRRRRQFPVIKVPEVWDCYFCDSTEPVEWSANYGRCVQCLATLLFDESLGTDTL